MRLLKTEMRFGLLLSALALASASSASAQETCTTSDDCDHGYECISSTACPDIACAPGNECEPLNCNSTSACVPKSDCAADADCAAGWRCATATYEQCDGGGSAAEPRPACDPADPDCVKEDPPQAPEPAEPPSCESITDSFCAPPWALPCETATDCGPGFECTERVSRCSSGGSSGSAGSGGGSDPSPGEEEGAPPPENLIAPPDCVDELSGVFACVLIETPCAVDADCDAGLTCQEGPNTAVCGGGATPTPGDSGGAGDGDLPADSDADRALPTDCTMPEPTYACAPPDYYTGYDTIGRDGEAASGSGDIDNGGNTSGGGVVSPVDPGGEDEDGAEPPAFGSPGAGDPNPQAESSDTMESSGGCSATGADASGSALLMLLAMLGLAKRRRQHA
jgi:MYXO-CTERM domain-containing protein